MPKVDGPIVEGIFAINKPSSLSSADVIRRLQRVFNPSKLFAPWMGAEETKRSSEKKHRGRTRSKRVQVKIGHGGTLDPMATGVLILGIGKGTKQLQKFLECTKTYEATVLFGAATDTYDILGKVLKRAPYEQVTQAKVEKALETFRGKIMQRPPIYSALRMDGKRLYEYAREGKEIPRQIEERPVEVKNLAMVEWMDAGSHQYTVLEEEAEGEIKEIAETVLHLEKNLASSEAENRDTEGNGDSHGLKRRRSPDDAADEALENKRPALSRDATDPSTLTSGALAQRGDNTSGEVEPSRMPKSGPPAVKLRMTVTSGFYVRSLAHDLGETIGSLACMSSLVRTKQADHELGKNVLEFEDIEEAEDVWAPKVKKLLEEVNDPG
ncbi:uncharacterized protein KY384_004851 [Bacidia gigantensis]|uniref:uncharacterized protein n=1 Tax=Bacidia gigantensis TaxID=2732470 RepID=UPI001D0587FD|nr:uncharacterized protein KY384_004851 [Bacidia gigantensis]KAG8530349.1 hypothetical protein KY384_004851 [Bacidia gigantensis]